MNWLKTYSKAARKQGWDIFDSDVRGLEIEKVDEYEDGSPPVFESDDEAFAYVIRTMGENDVADAAIAELIEKNPKQFQKDLANLWATIEPENQWAQLSSILARCLAELSTTRE